MLVKKMTVKLVLACYLMGSMLYAFPAQAAVIEDLEQVAAVVAPDTYRELSARVNSYTRIYRIEKGDTLEGIARRYHTDPELVAAMNYIEEAAVLKAGQFLVLPYELERSYRVVAGDTLWSISRRYGVDVKTLASANGITNAKTLQIGTVLSIPGSPESQFKRQETLPVSRSILPTSFVWPLVGRITSAFGWRQNEFHHGMDIAGDIGEKIQAALSGIVVFSGWANGIYGRMVKLDHGNGLETIYAHNSRNLVKVGDKVRRGDFIAEVGSTGNATGPHVHFEIRKDGKAVNPERYLNRYLNR